MTLTTAALVVSGFESTITRATRTKHDPLSQRKRYTKPDRRPVDQWISRQIKTATTSTHRQKSATRLELILWLAPRLQRRKQQSHRLVQPRRWSQSPPSNESNVPCGHLWISSR